MKRWSIAIFPLFLLIALSAQKDAGNEGLEVTDGPYINYSESRMYVNYIVKDGDTLARKVVVPRGPGGAGVRRTPRGRPPP